MVVEAEQTNVLKTGVAVTSVNPDLNFRLRLDIAGANIRIQDSLIGPDKDTGYYYVDRESGLDMDFEIVKTDDNIPNESTITIWNLSDSTYNSIAKQKGQGVELYAAWGTDDYSLMFRGYPNPFGQKIKKIGKKSQTTSSQGFLKQDANASRKGQNDIPTVLSLIDGKEATICKEYKNGVSTQTIIDDLIATLDMPIGKQAGVKHIMLDSFTARGKTSKYLNYFSKILDFKWTIINGTFYLFRGELPQQPYGIKLNSDNSSSPELRSEQFTVKSKKGTKVVNSYMIRTKLLPWLNPGTYCQCDFGEILQGVKYIYKVRHKGNNYGTVAESEVYIVDI